MIKPDMEPSVRERVLADLKATPKEAVVAFFRAHRLYDPIPALRSFRGPALSVARPSNDAPFSLHRLSTHLPHVTFDGSSHWLHLDKPAEFNRLLEEFVAQAESADA